MYQNKSTFIKIEHHFLLMAAIDEILKITVIECTYGHFAKAAGLCYLARDNVLQLF